MSKEKKEIQDSMQELREKLGIKAFEEVEKYLYTLYRKIEDLIDSRDKWKAKYVKLKNEK